MTTHHPRFTPSSELRGFGMLIAVATFMAGYVHAAGAATSDAKEEGAVRRLFAEFTDAFNGHEARKAAALCAEDVDYIVGSGDDIRGREAVEAHLQPLFAGRLSAMHRSAVLQEVRFLRPDVAVLIGYYETVGAIGPSGIPNPPTKGVYDWVVTRRDGRWLIRLWHEAFVLGAGTSHP